MGKPKLIHLTQGKFALVDREDYFKLLLKKWHLQKYPHNKCYAATSKRHTKTKCDTIKMHRFIMNVTESKVLIDHKDGNGLNNQKSNLRIANAAQNRANSVKCKNKKSSIYQGVCWVEERKKWRVKINVNRKQIQLGYFKEETDAAKAYNEAAIKYFGEFAKPNVIS
jgi:hypothetical protein